MKKIANESIDFAQQHHEGKVIAEKKTYKILDCNYCGFIHATAPQDVGKNDLYSSHFYEVEKPDYIDSNINDADWWDFTYGLRIERGDKIAEEPITTWLDVGTGPGLFLDAALKRGKMATGIEP